MDQIKEKNLLYFGENEIVKDKRENKQVFVTKRINGKETHTKIQQPIESEYKRVPNTQGFNFEREIVIGVNNKQDNKIENKKRKNSKKNAKKQKKSRKQENNQSKRKVKKIEHVKRPNISSNNPKRKSKKLNKKLSAILLLIIIVIGILVMALVTPIFNITEIKIEGAKKVSNDTIVKLSGLEKGQNIFNNSKKNIINNIKENPYIEEVKISKILPGTINLVITERNVDYQIKVMSSYIYIDKAGNILENSNIKEKVATIIGETTPQEELINGSNLNKEDSEKLTQVSKIIDAMKTANINTENVSINIEDENDFILYIASENKKVHIGDSTNLANKMLYMNKILEIEKNNSGSIFIDGDLNEGFKPYFREEITEEP